jgi:hypothetical protein
VAQINGQVRQPALHVSPLSVPGDKTVDGKGMPLMPISALAAACRLPDYAESSSKTSVGGGRAVFSFGIIRAPPGRPTGCHPAGIVLA